MKNIITKILIFLALATFEFGTIVGLIWLASFLFGFEFSLLYSTIVWFAVQVMHLIDRYRRNRQ